MNPLEEEEDGWPDEPDEFDPDSLGPDPPDSTRSLRDSLGATEAVPDDLFRAFWASVLLLNVALAALSIGAMFIYFRGDYGTGGLAMLIGAVAAAGTARYYWRFKTGRYATDGADADDSGTATGGAPTPDGDDGNTEPADERGQ